MAGTVLPAMIVTAMNSDMPGELIFPDGRSLSLPGLPTKDLRGASGIESEVDNHNMRLYGQGVLLSIVGAAAQLSQPQQSRVFGQPSPGQIAASEIGRQLSQISMETIRRNMDIRPTLKVEAGTAFYTSRCGTPDPPRST